MTRWYVCSVLQSQQIVDCGHFNDLSEVKPQFQKLHFQKTQTPCDHFRENTFTYILPHILQKCAKKTYLKLFLWPPLSVVLQNSTSSVQAQKNMPNLVLSLTLTVSHHMNFKKDLKTECECLHVFSATILLNILKWR